MEIPPGTSLEGTLFDFFRQYTIIEFKSRNDTLTAHKLLAQTSRVTLWQSEHKEVIPAQVLNFLVVSRLSAKLLPELAKKWGHQFRRKRGRKGFYKAQVGSQYIVLVVCDQLPLRPKYAPWLLFADPSTEKWRETVRMMATHQLYELLEEADRLYPKEYKAMSSEVETILANYYKPEEEEEYFQAVKELTEDRLIKMSPEQRIEVLSKLPVEERLKGLPVEERLKGLPPEQLGDALSKLPPEELAKILQKLQPPKQGQ